MHIRVGWRALPQAARLDWTTQAERGTRDRNEGMGIEMTGLELNRRVAHQNALVEENINIEALCAAPPEAFAHSPSQMPLSCPVAPPSQRELNKDGGGGGGGVARRARAARAPKLKSCATSCGTSSTTPRAASFTCSSFMGHLREGMWGGLASGSPHAASYLFFCPLKGLVRRALYVLVLLGVDRHCHWACCTKKFWGTWGWGQLGAGHGW